MIEAGVVDGLVVIGVTPEDGYLDWLLARRVPLVVMNRRPVRDEFSYVAIDNEGGGFLAAGRMAKLGHRKVALIRLPQILALSQEHRDGFLRGAEEHGLSVELDAQADHATEPDLRALCRELADRGVTGVFCEGDPLALACCQRLHAMGRAVPEAVSVIGFDGLNLRTADGRHLASVGFDAVRMGEEAARMLMKVVLQREFCAQMAVVVKTQVEEGETLGPAPGRSSSRVRSEPATERRGVT